MATHRSTSRSGSANHGQYKWNKSYAMFHMLPKQGFLYQWLDVGENGRRLLPGDEATRIMQTLNAAHIKIHGLTLKKWLMDEDLGDLFQAGMELLDSPTTRGLSASEFWAHACAKLVLWSQFSPGITGEEAYHLVLKVLEGRRVFLESATSDQMEKSIKFGGKAARMCDHFTAHAAALGIPGASVVVSGVVAGEGTGGNDDGRDLGAQMAAMSAEAVTLVNEMECLDHGDGNEKMAVEEELDDDDDDELDEEELDEYLRSADEVAGLETGGGDDDEEMTEDEPMDVDMKT